MISPTGGLIVDTLVPRDNKRSSANNGAAYLRHTLLMPLLCSCLAVLWVSMMAGYTRHVGSLFFGKDAPGSPAIYRKPPPQLKLEHHLAAVPFRSYNLLSFGVEPPGEDSFYDDGYKWWEDPYVSCFGVAMPIASLSVFGAMFYHEGVTSTRYLILLLASTVVTAWVVVREWVRTNAAGFETGEGAPAVPLFIATLARWAFVLSVITVGP